MAREIDPALRDLIARRASFRCEYCLLHEEDSYQPHQVDHIVSRKHGGLTVAGNLAWSCLRCNLWKGSDIGSLSSAGVLTPLFDPRRHRWPDHFRLSGAVIE